MFRNLAQTLIAYRRHDICSHHEGEVSLSEIASADSGTVGFAVEGI